MPRLRYFGCGGVVLDNLRANGWTLVEYAKEADAVVAECFDNRSPNPTERLQGTIGLIREVLDELEGITERNVLIITDMSSTTGNFRQGVTSGLAIKGIHGFGSSTVEVFGRMVLKCGMNTMVLRIEPQQVQEAKEKIQSFLSSYKNESEYQVLSW